MLYHTSSALQVAFQVYMQLYLYTHHVPCHMNLTNIHHMILHNCNHSNQEYILYYRHCRYIHVDIHRQDMCRV